MTSSSDLLPRLEPLDAVTRIYRIALPQFGRLSEAPSLRNQLKSIIRDIVERGVSDPVLAAQAAIDELVLSTGGRVRPS